MATVTAAREGEWWTLDAPDVGAYGQSATLGDAQSAAREFIALELDIELTEVEATIVPASGDEAARALRKDVKGGVECAHTPYREAAQALYMSAQCMHQLMSA
ncbi:hypothetical protein DEO23_15815 [Brachybacterium endophyticum]|uniref:HicB family protein n=1 Tax=Brachybacterium endophyticum TaxID=2182385 RepID=A0A2U2RGE5_9MICO|nr:hypothetical protein [Brachybacterium endophyticum]PWH04937.1 hypothetical protein DEO23_15815 [Brachybacterium endophyticum]